MANPSASASDSFPIVVSKSMLCRKHQFTLPANVARDLGLKKEENTLLVVTVNPESRYWISFYQQKGKGGGWRTFKSSEWTKLAHKHPIVEGDTLVFTKQEFQGEKCYVVRSPRLDKYNTRLGFDPDNLFVAPTFYSESSDDDAEVWKCRVLLDSSTSDDSDWMGDSEDEVNEDEDNVTAGDGDAVDVLSDED